MRRMSVAGVAILFGAGIYSASAQSQRTPDRKPHNFQQVQAYSRSRAGRALVVVAGEGTVALLAVAAILLGEVAGATNKVLAKQLTADVPAPVLLRDMGLVVTVATAAASLIFERELPMKFTPAAVAAFVYLGLVASFAASGLYLVLLRRFRVSSMS